MRKKIWICLALFSLCLGLAAQKIDLNRAAPEELVELPLSAQQLDELLYYRTYIGHFSSIYDLMRLDGFDAHTLEALRPLIRVEQVRETDEIKLRRSSMYYIIERLSSNEDAQEGASDMWEGILMSPHDINKITYRQLINLPNVTPQDAVAVLAELDSKGKIKDYRSLKNTPRLSSWGFRNLRNYVTYSQFPQRVFVDYQFKLTSADWEDDEETLLRENVSSENLEIYKTPQFAPSYWNFLDLANPAPSYSHKLRVRYGTRFQSGLVIHKEMGSASLNTENVSDHVKGYVSYDESVDWAGHTWHTKALLGNFQVGWAQGLVMENNDTYSPRKTGYGFGQRMQGVIGDVSHIDEFALRGFATSLSMDNLVNVDFFFSNDEKDAVIWDSNLNGYLDDEDAMLSYVVMHPQMTNKQLKTVEDTLNARYLGNTPILVAPRKDAFQEKTMGGRVEISPTSKFHVGVSGYESIYDRDFAVSKNDELLSQLMYHDQGNPQLDKIKIMDNEFFQSYSTSTDEYQRDYRRVMGLDFSFIHENTCFQGEYAELKVNGDALKLGDDPKAMVFSAYTLFNSFYLLGLYRDYDVDFDNPYARPFSEKSRYDDTVFEKYPHEMRNPILAQIALNAPGSQAERGFYLETRYQLSRDLSISRAYIDVWERKADSRKSMRFQGQMDYRPIYQVALRLKHKWLVNGYGNTLTKHVSRTSETTLSTFLQLSKRDFLRLEYMYSQTWFPPYPYLTNDAEAELDNTTVAGTELLSGDYINVDYTHNFTEEFKVQGAFLVWGGHGASMWDFEDDELEFFGGNGIKYWFKISDRISNNLFVSFKYKVKRYLDRSLDNRTWYNTNANDDVILPDIALAEKEQHSFKVQVDWKF